MHLSVLARLSAAAAVISLSAGVSEAAAGGVVLAPHRATYALTLDGSKAAKKVEAVQGEIVYELRGNPCEGYSVKLRQFTEIDTDGGGRMTNALSTATWEDGEAKSYRFRIENKVNSEARDDADGIAERKDGRIVVKATKPTVESFDLKGSVVLPTQHVLKILSQAAQGEPVLEAPVYDGSPDGKKVYDTLAVIGKATTADQNLEQAAKSTGLAGRTRYPVTISYFEQGTDAQTPDYIISFDLFDNGVSRALKLDYGDFALRGTLTSYEALPAGDCSK